VAGSHPSRLRRATFSRREKGFSALLPFSLREKVARSAG